MPTKRGVLLAGSVFFAATLVFGFRLSEEKFFADESSYVAQTYYYRLLLSGDWNHVDWVHPAAYDHLQFPKYVMGVTLHAAGMKDNIPRSLDSWERWMGGNFDPPSDQSFLLATRWSMVLCASLGCAMVFVLGWQAVGPKTGVLAALLLAASPLYYTHARRAMADDLVQTMVAAGIVGFIALARSLVPRRLGGVVASTLLGGLAGGLAVASKLNGVACCLATVATTVVIVLVASFGRSATSAQRRGARALILAIIVLQAVSLGTFIGINPYFFARPVLPEVTESPPAFVTIAGKRRPRAGAMELQRIARMSVLERFGYLFTYRTSGLSEAVQRFPNDALTTPADRLREIVREGLGRWTFAGRFGVDGMLAGAVTGAIVALGMVVAVALGQRERREGKLPGVWILAVWPVVETAVLLNNLTLNWDRYYMGVVTWASVLAAVAIGGTLNGLKERMVLTPPVRERGE